jgi:hypothetical protein
MKNFWKNGFSVYTENKDIIFIQLESIKNNNTEYVKDYTGRDFLLFQRTYNIFTNLKSYIKYDDYYLPYLQFSPPPAG